MKIHVLGNILPAARALPFDLETSMLRSLSRLTLLGGLIAAAGCGDPLRPEAQLPVITDTLTAFALTGTPLTAASALGLFSLSVVPPRSIPGSFEADFDLAFDLDEQGRVRLFPASRLGLSSRRLGFQESTVPFAELLRAPKSGYVRDTVFIARVGTPVVIEAEIIQCGGFSFSPFIYSKLIIDSVSTSRRAIFFRAVTDPNCGFRSFEEGVPED